MSCRGGGDLLISVILLILTSGAVVVRALLIKIDNVRRTTMNWLHQ